MPTGTSATASNRSVRFHSVLKKPPIVPPSLRWFWNAAMRIAAANSRPVERGADIVALLEEHETGRGQQDEQRLGIERREIVRERPEEEEETEQEIGAELVVEQRPAQDRRPHREQAGEDRAADQHRQASDAVHHPDQDRVEREERPVVGVALVEPRGAP